MVSKFPTTIPGGQSMVLATFSSGVNCISFPLTNPATICFPFGDQQQHRVFRLGSSEWNSMLASFSVYVLSPPLDVTTARVAGLTGFQQS